VVIVTDLNDIFGVILLFMPFLIAGIAAVKHDKKQRISPETLQCFTARYPDPNFFLDIKNFSRYDIKTFPHGYGIEHENKPRYWQQGEAIYRPFDQSIFWHRCYEIKNECRNYLHTFVNTSWSSPMIYELSNQILKQDIEFQRQNDPLFTIKELYAHIDAYRQKYFNIYPEINSIVKDIQKLYVTSPRALSNTNLIQRTENTLRFITTDDYYLNLSLDPDKYPNGEQQLREIHRLLDNIQTDINLQYRRINAPESNTKQVVLESINELSLNDVDRWELEYNN